MLAEGRTSLVNYSYSCPPYACSPRTAAGKKGKKKSKGKTLSLNDFLSDVNSGTNYVKDPPKAPVTTNWADATEDLDPSGECKVQHSSLCMWH